MELSQRTRICNLGREAYGSQLYKNVYCAIRTLALARNFTLYLYPERKGGKKMLDGVTVGVDYAHIPSALRSLTVFSCNSLPFRFGALLDRAEVEELNEAAVLRAMDGFTWALSLLSALAVLLFWSVPGWRAKGPSNALLAPIGTLLNQATPLRGLSLPHADLQFLASRWDRDHERVRRPPPLPPHNATAPDHPRNTRPSKP